MARKLLSYPQKTKSRISERPCCPTLSEGMTKRREKRIVVPITVRIWGLDRNGRLFSQNAKTVDITSTGARLHGVKASIDPGFVVGLECDGMKSRFIVTWVGEEGSSREGQVGLRSTENGIWNIALPKVVGDDWIA